MIMINKDTTEMTASKEKKANKKVETDNSKVIMYDDLQGKFLLVRVGTPEVPATTQQISDVKDSLLDLFEKNNVDCMTYVTHHAVDVQIVEKQNPSKLV